MFEKIFNNTLFRIVSLMKPRQKGFFISIISQVTIGSLFSVNEAFVIKSITNALLQKDFQALITSLIVFFIVILFVISFHPVANWFYNINSKQIIAKTRSLFFRKLLRLPLSYFEKMHSGDIISRLNTDGFAVEEIYGNKLGRFIGPVVRIIVIIITMIIISWKAGIIFIFINCFYVFINVLFSKPIKAVSRKYFQNMGKLTAKAVDFISGYSIIKIFNLDKIMMDSYSEVSKDISVNFTERHKLEGCLGSVNFFLKMFNTLGMIIIGSLLVARNVLDFGSLLALINIQSRLNSTMLFAAETIPLLQDAIVGGGRLLEFLDEPPEKENGTAMNNKPINTVELKGINFSYVPSRSILHDINFSINKGQMIAIIGPSGSGKSTVLKLLLGFYAPQKGNISFNNEKYDEYSLQNIRKNIAFVTQDPYLFNGTIIENIRFGRMDAPEAEIFKAAEDANAHNFVKGFPDGYNTVLKDGGANLSGGQRQRIAIARAILKNAPVLLLDEATSALDSRSETELQKALKRLFEKSTTIVVAHRLSTIRNADKIYVINGGRIIDSGSFNKIYKKRKIYLANKYIS